MSDLIDRQYAIRNYQHVCRRTNCKECPLHTKSQSFGSAIHEFSDCELELFLHNLPSAQSDVADTNAGDMISRQAALRTDCFGDGHDGLRAFHVYEDYKKMRDYIEALPSAQPERKKGKWEEMTVIHKDEAREIVEEWQSARCSICGHYDTRPYMYYVSEPNFCSWCGSEMRKGAEDE